MIAVKTKRRLQTHPNIPLACLALTDLMVELVVQPLHITGTIFLLEGKDFHECCDIYSAFYFSLVISCWASVFYLLLIIGGRYLAIKHNFAHSSVKFASCFFLLWRGLQSTFPSHIIVFKLVMAFALLVITLSSITLFQILI